jgi:cell division septum initiation protein DivIVA
MPDSNIHFRNAVHGYDRAQVDQHVNQLAQASAAVWQEASERTLQVSQLEDANALLKEEVRFHSERALALDEAQREAAAPSYEGLGARVVSILSLAEQEAQELRSRAKADVANIHALAEDSALAIRQEADDYALERRIANDDEAARVLEDAQQRADTLLQDAEQRADTLLEDAKLRADTLLDEADRQAMARQDADRLAMAQREDAEAAYEQARASTAAAAVDFETTLAARREASAQEFAAQITAAEEQLATVRQRSEQTRKDIERTQQEAETKSAKLIEQAVASAATVVAEAKSKAELIRGNSERDLASATHRRESINAQINIARRDLAALGGVPKLSPVGSDGSAGDLPNGAMATEYIAFEEALTSQNGAASDGFAQSPAHEVVDETQNGSNLPQTGEDLDAEDSSGQELTDEGADDPQGGGGRK